MNPKGLDSKKIDVNNRAWLAAEKWTPAKEVFNWIALLPARLCPPPWRARDHALLPVSASSSDFSP